MTTEVTGRLHDVGQRIIDSIGLPNDEWEIAAHLEVMGLRDTDARNVYGAGDLFDMARQIYATFQAGGYKYFVEGYERKRRLTPILRFLRDYIDGLTFSLPMALQAVTMLIWGYGLWGAIDLDLRTGSSIALGFILSYVLAGGFCQAIVRRGLFYVYQEEQSLARWTALRGWSLSVSILLGLMIPAFLFNVLFRVLPWSMFLTAAAYYAALSVLWINWGLIYLVRKTDVFLLIMVVSLAVVVAAAVYGNATPIAANMFGLASAGVLSFAVALRELNRRAKREGKPPINPPRLTVMIYSTSRFFLYGVLYNAFLFADRVIAWTTPVGRDDLPPYAFWLNVRYELGMDLALIVVVLLSGVVEFTTRWFSEALVPDQHGVKSTDHEKFVRDTSRAFQVRRFYLAIASPFAVAAAVGVAIYLRAQVHLSIHASLKTQTTMIVFAVAAISYVIFMFGLQNILTLLTLGRVDMAARAVGIALIANLAVGYVCSRAVHYAAAVVGLFVGAVILTWLSTRSVRRVLDRLDFHFYAGF